MGGNPMSLTQQFMTLVSALRKPGLDYSQRKVFLDAIRNIASVADPVKFAVLRERCAAAIKEFGGEP